MIVVGLMSGTSADGTDAAVLEIDGAPPALEWRLVHHLMIPHPPELREAILAAMQPQTGTVDRLCRLNVELGYQFARVALAAIKESGLRADEVDLIGSHGQTFWHDPPGGAFGSTLQLGEAAVIAEETGVMVINNFRARDMAAGGHGAPLVSAVDVLLLTDEQRIRVAQNIGGIANLTFLPSRDHTVWQPFAFDTGPGNVLLDYAATWSTGGASSYDRGGELAARGKVDASLLNDWLAHPYFHEPPPKSTGRELYTAGYAARLWAQAEERGLRPEDTLATLTSLTARSIAAAYRDFLPALPDEIIVSGGGARNPTLMRHLEAAVAPAKVFPSDRFGIPGDAKEALAFAVLAYESWHRRPGNLPAATGAHRPVILGQITPGNP